MKTQTEIKARIKNLYREQKLADKLTRPGTGVWRAITREIQALEWVIGEE